MGLLRRCLDVGFALMLMAKQRSGSPMLVVGDAKASVDVVAGFVWRRHPSGWGARSQMPVLVRRSIVRGRSTLRELLQ